MRGRREHSKIISRRYVLEVGLARAALDGALDGGEGLVVPVALGGLDGAVNDVLNKELQRKSAAAENEDIMTGRSDAARAVQKKGQISQV